MDTEKEIIFLTLDSLMRISKQKERPFLPYSKVPNKRGALDKQGVGKFIEI